MQPSGFTIDGDEERGVGVPGRSDEFAELQELLAAAKATSVHVEVAPAAPVTKVDSLLESVVQTRKRAEERLASLRRELADTAG